MREIEIYCGGISQDQENGAWGTILISGDYRKEICGVEKGSSQRIILLSVIKGLEAIKISRANVKIHVPLKLFVRCVEENLLVIL